MFKFENLVVTPEVQDAVARAKANPTSAPIAVIITPQDGSTPEDVKKVVMSAGVAEKDIESAEHFVFVRLLPSQIEQISGDKSLNKIWLDREMGIQLQSSLKTIQALNCMDAEGKVETCEDVAWAVLDDGIDASHPALKACDVENFDLTGEGPVGGHGTHIAGIIGGFCPEDNFYGVAPKCKILNFKVIGQKVKSTSVVIKAMEMIRQMNDKAGRLIIQGANMSLGSLDEENFKVFSPGHSPVCDEANRLVASGVCVAVAAGNFGAQYYMTSQQQGMPVFAPATIADPGAAELPVTVGSTHKELPNRYGVSVFSSKGPTGDGRLKPDLIAPGEKILSCIPPGIIPGQIYAELSGTSQATAHVSGVMAFLLHRYPDLKGHPNTVKDILVRSSRDIFRDRTYQGQGVVSLSSALQLTSDRAG